MSGALRHLVGAVALLAACGGANAGQADPKACAPVDTPASGLTAAGLAGEYMVQLIATSGGKQGASAAGRLALQAQDTAYQSMERPDGTVDTTFSFPLYGTADVDFAAVGATTPGDVRSSDPQSPGVLVIERPGGVMLRLGSDANRRGVRRFDGGFTVLQVQQVTDSGFSGTWRSAVGLEGSGGHFCATRTS
jgi:hypothetical protein